MITKKMPSYDPVRTNPNGAVPVQVVYDANINPDFLDIDLALIPKGTGAIVASKPDGAVAGGNKRGSRAVDLQLSRADATQVASGAGAFLAGTNGTASGSNSVSIGSTNAATNTGSVAMGSSNTASGSNASAIGTTNTASGSHSFAGGSTNTASSNAAVAIGRNNTANAASSFAVGAFATTNSITGQVAMGHASGTLGRYQTTITGLGNITTSTAATALTTDAAAAAAGNQLTLRNNSAFSVRARVVVFDTVAGTAACFEINNILIKRGANAAATSLVGTPTVTTIQSDIAVTPTVAVTADTTNGSLRVTGTATSTNSTRWKVTLFADEAQT